MRNLLSLGVLALASSTHVAGYKPESTKGSDILAAQALDNLRAAVASGSLKSELATKNVLQECNIESAAVRREYSTLTDEEKLDYIQAVSCMMGKPSISPPEIVPGARSRYDDFVATHINQTMTIHVTGNFLAWHRYFVHAWETALRDECGYKGYQPYWNWGKSALDPINSPYMDGSPLSQGGNGVFAAHNCSRLADSICIPPGGGGGCVESGPYGKMIANISANDPVLDLKEDPIVVGAMMSYGPRCVRRDISPWVTSQWLTDNKTVELLTNPLHASSIGSFQAWLQGDLPTGSSPGLHGAGHFTWAGDPGGDFYNSPNDPLFWLHHGQIDRTWWVWQNQDPVSRAFQIAGTRTMNDQPPSSNATIDDLMDLGFNAPASPLRDHVSTVAGPYCYIYM